MSESTGLPSGPSSKGAIVRVLDLDTERIRAAFLDDIAAGVGEQHRAGAGAVVNVRDFDVCRGGTRQLAAAGAAGTTFRFRSIVEHSDGTSIEFFDTGEIDAEGRIATILVFTGPLADATG